MTVVNASLFCKIMDIATASIKFQNCHKVKNTSCEKKWKMFY